MRQTKLALHSATVGDTTYRGWGIAGPMSNIQHNHDNRTIVAGNQFNVSSSGSGNVSVGNVTTNEQAGGKRERYKSNKQGSPSRRRHKNENSTNYSANINLNTIGLLIRPLLSSFSSPEPFKLQSSGA